eukprot:2536074-Rhodomonas_salina.1
MSATVKQPLIHEKHKVTAPNANSKEKHRSVPLRIFHRFRDQCNAAHDGAAMPSRTPNTQSIITAAMFILDLAIH